MRVAFTSPVCAVIVARPLATAVTSPVLFTAAVVVSLDDQVRVGLTAITEPSASFTVAVAVAVSPGVTNTSESGESVIEAATWSTVTAAVPLAKPDVAVIVAVPFATEVTRPAEETVATDSSDVAHVTVGAEMVDPAAFLTVAVS